MHEPPIKTKVYAKDIKDAEQIIEKTITATLKKGDNDKL